MKELKIALIGQPNVGKSCLLNALVGPRVQISNYPGTTVEVTKAKKVFNRTKVVFEDTPGIYSISDRSEEEKVTKRVLFEEKVDKVVVVADTTSLERSLYLVLQILESGIPVVIALNFVEDAEKKGIKIDCEKLKKILHVPAVFINPLTKKGMDNLTDELLKDEKGRKTFTPRYDDHIEKAIEKISKEIKETQLPKRFVALRVLEDDMDFYGYVKDEKIFETVKEGLHEHPKVSEDISITRYGTAAFIAEKVTQITRLGREKRLQYKIDNVLLHETWGPVLTILSFSTLFGVLLFIGSLVQEALLGFTESILSPFLGNGSVVGVIVSQALYGVMAGISIALPYVFLFYLLLGLMEDVGILPRFVVNLERFLKRLNLPGKSLIPLILGLGCTVPAVRATRVLSHKKKRFCTASFLTFVPCSSRIAIIMGVVGYYGGMLLSLLVFATLLVSALIWAFMMKKLVRPETTPLILELPPYRKPSVKNIAIKSWIRMKDFVYIVIPLLAIGGAVYAVLDITGVTNIIVTPLSPLAWWLGLPPLTIIPIVFGFLQKDLTGAMLLSVLGTEIGSVLSPLQMYTFGVATTIQIPCIIALGALIKEFGFKKAILLTCTSVIYGLSFAGLVWRAFSFF